MEAAAVLKHRRRRQRVLLEPSLSLCYGGFLSASARMAKARCSQLGGNPNPRAMQRRFGVASEEGSSSLPGLIGATRYPIGPSGLTLVRCPRCGSAVVECRSWRQGGRVFFKCEDNEQFVPNCCTFFKWIKSYKKMVEAMELNYPDEAMSDVAMPMVADIVEKRPNSVIDAKIEKLARSMQILVFMNCSTLVFVLCMCVCDGTELM
ncbi:hypothetical protein OsI_19834 [Oryza sativa Indica Group]|uniref:Zinc finger GRF-type domain-containing protein n=1 Tax=Oryza sativa subsp. indica TaxID=39946 RepID=B8AXZ3_ORYSI|nr:hypothetical protein OsI_19834 [Oryza sativa Indica Group]